MATCNLPLQPPSTFNVATTPSKWPKWKRRSKQFRTASGLLKLSEEEDAGQISALLYSLGDDTVDVLTSTNISKEDSKKYNKALKKFDRFFEVRKNVIFERSQEVLSKGDTKTFYLGTIGDDSVLLPKSWKVQLLVDNKEVSFKLDTSAEVTAITEQSYQSIGSPCLQKPQKQLRGPNKHPLDVIGTFTTTVSYKNKSCSTDIYVVRNLVHNLLGLLMIADLHLIVLVDAIQSDRATLQQKFPSHFTGLGTLQNKYDIRLKPDAKPFTLSTARHVPIPLHAKVQAELEYMQSLNVISKVDQPTPRCAGMVVVPKKASKVRICVDLKSLNESVLQETHHLPHVDEILAQLNGATIFSKLDANSGFWQIPFTEQSKLLTTLITPFGCYCFNKLPFGITSAPEFFQKQMIAILAGLEGVLCLMDDILVFDKDRTEHDKRLYMAMNQIQQGEM